MDENKDPITGASTPPKKAGGLFDYILEPENRTPEKNRILFMCLALFLAAIAVITLIGFFQ
jgi:hypothetical protein